MNVSKEKNIIKFEVDVDKIYCVNISTGEAIGLRGKTIKTNTNTSNNPNIKSHILRRFVLFSLSAIESNFSLDNSSSIVTEK